MVARSSCSCSFFVASLPMATSRNFSSAAPRARARPCSKSSLATGKAEAKSKVMEEKVLTPSSTARSHSWLWMCNQASPRLGTPPLFIASMCSSSRARKMDPFATSPFGDFSTGQALKTCWRSSRICPANFGRMLSTGIWPNRCRSSSSSTGLTSGTQSRSGKSSMIFSRASRFSAHFAGSGVPLGGCWTSENLLSVCSRYSFAVIGLPEASSKANAKSRRTQRKAGDSRWPGARL
mmetsp:Transcript_70356/g.222269  ORF Transcript_70356/g.222269 Transcript_70356/m.222269 type:complete len:236 (-) Transcript_70356:136-843(-)